MAALEPSAAELQRVREDELEALRYIYGDRVSISSDDDAHTRVAATVHRADGGELCVTFVMDNTYPAQPCVAIELEGVPKGFATRARERIVEATARRGEPIIYACVSELEALFGENHASAAPAEAAVDVPAPRAPCRVPVWHGEPVVVMRSTFQAHVARVWSDDDVASVYADIRSDRRTGAATHNMAAWTFPRPAHTHAHTHAQARAGEVHTATVADHDDDGEDGAGARLSHLLHVLRVSGVMVVVSRWFGGVLLGPARWRVIGQTARAAIEAQDWYEARDRV